MEVITTTFSEETHVQKATKRQNRRTNKRRRPTLLHLPREVLQSILFTLDPRSAASLLSTCRHLLYLGTPRFWMSLLASYWENQMTFDEEIGERLGLSKVQPNAQIHFVSNYRFSLGLQEIGDYCRMLCTSWHIPFDGAQYLGLTLPHMPIRNCLARFYPDRQFYIAAYGASDTLFNFNVLVLDRPKLSERERSKRSSPKRHVPRHFLPIGLRGCDEQEAFVRNFRGARVKGTTDAMLLAQGISSLFRAIHGSKSTLGRISIKLPGISSLPPPTNITRYFIRATLLLSRIPSLALEFKFEDSLLCDVAIHPPSAPWAFSPLCGHSQHISHAEFGVDNMPKYYCDYCDTFLTHDSASVRKLHIEGSRHQSAVRAYYAQLAPEYQDAPDRDAVRFEKMKDDAMRFMMMGPPIMPMGHFPPMMPPGGFPPNFPPYGPPPGQQPPPRFDARGPPPPRFGGGWNDKRGAPRADGRGPSGDTSFGWDDRNGPPQDQFRNYGPPPSSSAPTGDMKGPPPPYASSSSAPPPQPGYGGPPPPYGQQWR